MAQFVVKETSFIGNSLREPGDIVELPDDTEVSANLEAADPPSKGKAKSAE